MIQELIVILACMQSDGCSQATNAYYSTHPAFKQIIKDKNRKINEALGPELITLAPFIMLETNGKATIHLSKHLGLKIDGKENRSIILQFSF